MKKESGPDHAKTFTIQLNLGDKQYIGEGGSIKLAQRAAAETALVDQKSLSVPDNPPAIPQRIQNLFFFARYQNPRFI